MEDNSQQLNNLNDLNNENHSQGQNFGNISSNNTSDLIHEFENNNNSFNGTNLIEQYGVPEKESSSSK